MNKERPKLKIVADFRVVNGYLVQIDPLKTDLPDRCKLIFAEVITGAKCELVPREKSDS